MASENRFPPNEQIDHPGVIIQRMFTMVEDLKKRLNPDRELEHRTGRSNSLEGSGTINLNNSLGRIVETDPPLGSNHFGDPVLKLTRHLELLKDRLFKLEDLQEDVKRKLVRYSHIFDRLEKVDSSGGSSRGKRIVEDISMVISDILCDVPLVPGKQRGLYSHDDHSSGGFGEGIVYMPGIHTNEEELIKCETFREVTRKFKKLDTDRQICLLSFGVFPENREVHRTMLMHWWVGEGVFPVKGAEEAVREVLKELVEEKLIEPVHERRKVTPSSYKMTPFVHSSIVHLSKKMGFMDMYHKGCKPSMNLSAMRKVFLVEGSVSQIKEREKMQGSHIETVFNVSEIHPDFTIQWFSKMQARQVGILSRITKISFKSVNVFYLGRWERTQKRNIEVQNHNLMKFLKRLRRVKLVSFQGISTIKSLQSSVCELHELIILDLRECYGLTKLPEKIGSLRNLVYLDMTGCYMLEWIPLRLAWLKKLEVLKGFVVSDSLHDSVACKLIYLKYLTKLRKLSIEINRDDLGVHQLMEDLVELKALTSLKVKWRITSLYITRPTKPDEDSANIKSFIGQLNKLELQCFPHEQLPTWLYPQNLLRLRKLHIGGGRLLKGFGDLPKKATQCSVEVLRLTSLPKLRVGWLQLKKIYFPKLIFLEKYECPRVTLTPCDGDGIWRSDQD